MDGSCIFTQRVLGNRCHQHIEDVASTLRGGNIRRQHRLIVGNPIHLARCQPCALHHRQQFSIRHAHLLLAVGRQRPLAILDVHHAEHTRVRYLDASKLAIEAFVEDEVEHIVIGCQSLGSRLRLCYSCKGRAAAKLTHHAEQHLL